MSIENKARRIVRSPDACVECGACVGQCNTGALSVDEKTYAVALDDELCSACGLCVDACAFSAIFAIGERVAPATTKEEGHAAHSQL